MFAHSLREASKFIFHVSSTRVPNRQSSPSKIWAVLTGKDVFLLFMIIPKQIASQEVQTHCEVYSPWD